MPFLELLLVHLRIVVLNLSPVDLAVNVLQKRLVDHPVEGLEHLDVWVLEGDRFHIFFILLEDEIPNGLELLLGNELSPEYAYVGAVEDSVPVLLEEEVDLGDVSIVLGVFGVVIIQQPPEAGVDESFLLRAVVVFKGRNIDAAEVQRSNFY